MRALRARRRCAQRFARLLADTRQGEASAPTRMYGARQGGIAGEFRVAMHVGERRLAGHGDQCQIARQVRDAQVGESAVLSRARPRSWWSWARPKRSACSTIMRVALGTSTPTSMTVVETRTWVSPRSKRAMASWREAASSRPWTRST